MHQPTDTELLETYATTRSETAFAELVRRHVDFVHSAAVRLVRDPHLAQDVTQGTFVALAQGASQVAGHPVLAGWLHRTTRNIAAQTVRTIERRRAREQEAVAMNQLLSAASDPDWETIAPHLDDALGELDEAERDAVLLRYFQKKSAGEMAGILGISDEAAQKRVARAVDRLRDIFARRKVTIGAGALVAALAANTVTAAPAGFAVTITTAALAGTALSASATVTATKIIAMTTLQKIAIAATIALLAGAGIYEARQAAQLRTQNQGRQTKDSDGQIQQLQSQLAGLTNRFAGVLAENARLRSNANDAELLKLRGLVGVLHRQNGELLQGLQNAEKLNHPTFPTNFVSRNSLAFAGYDTPENSLETGLWAKSIGNEKAWRDITAPEMTNLLNIYVQGNTDAERSQFLIDKTKDLTGYKILSETPVAQGEVLMQMEYDWQANGQTGNSVSMLVMKQIDGQWKVYDEYANSDQVADLLKALNSKDSSGADPANDNPAPASPVRVIGK